MGWKCCRKVFLFAGLSLFPLNRPNWARLHSASFIFGRLPGIVLLFSGVFGYSVRADAEIIRFRMTGTVTVYDPTFVLPAGVVTGAPFTAFLKYDTNLPDSLPDDPRRGRYEFNGSGTAFDLSLTVASLRLRHDPTDDFTVQVIDDAPFFPGFSPPSDSLLLQVDSLGGPNVPTDLVQPRLTVVWDNIDQDSWNSDNLPMSVIPLDIRRAEILADGGTIPLGRPYSITGSVTQMMIVPEPCTITYAVYMGILGLAFRHRPVRFSPPANRLINRTT